MWWSLRTRISLLRVCIRCPLPSGTAPESLNLNLKTQNSEPSTLNVTQFQPTRRPKFFLEAPTPSQMSPLQPHTHKPSENTESPCSVIRKSTVIPSAQEALKPDTPILQGKRQFQKACTTPHCASTLFGLGHSGLKVLELEIHFRSVTKS